MGKKRFGIFAALVLCLSLTLAACGGGGGGGGSATLVSIAVTPATSNIATGTTQQFTATGTYSDSTTQDLKASAAWSSSDTAVATVSSAGLATSVAAGTTTITATSGGIYGTATLTVTAATLGSIAVTPTSQSIKIGSTKQFTATGTFSDSATQDLTTQATWNSSNTGKATINSAGLATSVALGSTAITASLSGVTSNSATLTITSAVNVPKTGQIVSYPTATSPDDGFYKRGVAWPEPRFTVGAGAEVDCVTDNLTGLMWVKAPDSTLRTWQQALDYADGLTLCGHTDWRLPNRKELRSLANYGEINVATWLNTQGFSNVQASYYWSSTTYAGNTTIAWIVDMFDGDVYHGTKTVSVYVWPVRGGQEGNAPAETPKTGQIVSYPTATSPDDGFYKRGVAWPDPRFTVGAGAEVDCVTDNLTGLMWVKAPDSTFRTWEAALDHADGLDLCGHNDWRLPNLNELESLVHAEYTNAALCGGGCSSNAAWLNTQGFSNVQAHYYWSSTTYASNTSDAWIVHMYDGHVFHVNKTNNYYVWPVRSGQ